MMSSDNQMNSAEDRDKVISAFGGKKGLIDSGIPAVIFLVIFNVTKDLQSALIASIAISALLTVIRLARRDTLQHALSGFIGVLICAWFANRTGNASDLYIPKLLTNLGYGSKSRWLASSWTYVGPNIGRKPLMA